MLNAVNAVSDLASRSNHAIAQHNNDVAAWHTVGRDMRRVHAVNTLRQQQQQQHRVGTSAFVEIVMRACPPSVQLSASIKAD